MNKHSFTTVPGVRFNRTQMDLSHIHKTTMNVGDLVPVYVEEVLPGDTFKLSAKFLSRLTSSFVKVPLDNLYLDLNFFFVPNRLIWDKWVNLMGENTSGYWTNAEVVSVPQVVLDTSSYFGSGFRQSLLDYLGVSYPAASYDGENLSFSQMPPRAFAKIWNDWYRNENTQAPVLLEVGDTLTVTGIGEWAPNNIFGKPPKVSKFHDYFTSALPQAQKGDPVTLAFGSSDLTVPVSALANDSVSTWNGQALRFIGENVLPADTHVSAVYNSRAVVTASTTSGSGSTYVAPSNLWATLTGADTGISVNDIRYAFAVQNILERDARYGTRYTEYLQGQWGVTNPDLRLTRSEYLGGFRTPIQFQEVAQTSQGTEDSPQANLSAYSKALGQGGFVKSFGEDGFVLGIACIRQKHTYSQGTDKYWLRKNRFDFYNPALAHIGEQPIFARQLVSTAPVGQIFGYQEAWAEYRYHPDRVSGFMRPQAEDTLAVWNFADNFAGIPTLNQSFLNETSAYVDRTLSVPSTLTPNFIVDFAFTNKATRLMPLYGTPELVDHVTTR